MKKKDLTFVLMSCGELSEEDCIEALRYFRKEIRFFSVRHVYPQIKALNKISKLNAVLM